MARKNWNRWFFASRRGQIITLLRRSSRTVDELAQVLGLTHTAVRAHLAALERDGLGQDRRGMPITRVTYCLQCCCGEIEGVEGRARRLSNPFCFYCGVHST